MTKYVPKTQTMLGASTIPASNIPKEFKTPEPTKDAYGVKDFENFLRQWSPQDRKVVPGTLDIFGATHIKTLPSKLIVMGDCDLTKTGITELPDDLSVSGDLILFNTAIKKIPATIVVRGKIEGGPQKNPTTKETPSPPGL